MSVERPPEHVLAAFGLSGARPVPLGSGWEGGWRCGEVVLSMVADHARSAWSAKVRETLFVDGVRLARPVRSTDGRYVVAGWRADTFVAGTPEPRHDEVVSAAVRLHEATAKLERPRFLTQPPVAPWADVDVFIAADRAAWEERPLHSLPSGARVAPGSSDGQRSVELINQLAGLRRPTRLASQLVHGDLYGTVLFAGRRHRASPTSRRIGGRRPGRPAWSSSMRSWVTLTTASSSAGIRCRNGRRCCCAR